MPLKKRDSRKQVPQEKNKAIIPTKEHASVRKKIAAPVRTGTEVKKKNNFFATAKKKTSLIQL